jgi:hypothetical protein
VIKPALDLKPRFSGHNMTVLISSQARENSRIGNKVGLTRIATCALSGSQSEFDEGDAS